MATDLSPAPPSPRERTYSGRRFVVGVVLAAAVFVAFLVFVSPQLLEWTLRSAPPPAPHEIATGEAGGTPWRAVAVEAGPDEPCLELTAGASSERLCTGPRGPSLRTADGFAVGGATVLHGIVDARTTTVRLTYVDGADDDVAVRHVDFGFPLGFFATALPGDAELRAVEALDRDGERRGAATCATDAGTLTCTVDS